MCYSLSGSYTAVTLAFLRPSLSIYVLRSCRNETDYKIIIMDYLYDTNMSGMCGTRNFSHEINYISQILAIHLRELQQKYTITLHYFRWIFLYCKNQLSLLQCVTTEIRVIELKVTLLVQYHHQDTQLSLIHI